MSPFKRYLVRCSRVGFVLVSVAVLGSGCSRPAGDDARFFVPSPEGADLQKSPTYLLRPGDQLRISVWKEEGLNQQVLVRPDGKISFPLAGHVDAAGRTTQQLEAIIKARLARFIDQPVVTVSLVAVPKNEIYVIGQVARPGAFPAVQPLTVMQLLSLAGGLTPFADEDNIVILRRVDGKQVPIRFDYSKAKRGIDLEQNIVLKSGDVVVVAN